MQSISSRRRFLATAAAAAGGTLLDRAAAAPFHARSSDAIRVGVVGCGGRGTGAALDCLAASEATRIVALADAFEDRLRTCQAQLEGSGERAKVEASRCYKGLGAYRELMASGVDLVILATPPGFRPLHFAEAVDRGLHVFLEKPVAVDPAGVRRVLTAAEEASRKKLCVVAGTQRRHERSYREAVARIHGGDIGVLTAARCSWNQGGLWKTPRKEGWSDVEWQIRNWLYFTWLSGDHIVEQHVHNLDVVNWVLGAFPKSAVGSGGRQVRTGSDYGNVYDHFAVEYEYENGFLLSSQARQIDGCDTRVEERIVGSEGSCTLRPGYAKIEGKKPWIFRDEDNNPYAEEHADLVRAISRGVAVNEAFDVAKSTLTAILGRMSAYTGKTVSWDQALRSKLSLVPEPLEFGDLPVAAVAIPGRTPLD